MLVAGAAAGLAIGGESFWAGVLAPVLTMSLGMAIVVAPLTTTVMNSVPAAQSGAASGVNNAASRLAGLFAIAIVGAIASLVLSRLSIHSPCRARPCALASFPLLRILIGRCWRRRS
jgi:hypothetical protein